MVGMGLRTKTAFPILFGAFFSGMPMLMALLVMFTVTLFTLVPFWFAMAAWGYRLGGRDEVERHVPLGQGWRGRRLGHGWRLGRFEFGRIVERQQLRRRLVGRRRRQRPMVTASPSGGSADRVGGVPAALSLAACGREERFVRDHITAMPGVEAGRGGVLRWHRSRPQGRRLRDRGHERRGSAAIRRLEASIRLDRCPRACGSSKPAAARRSSCRATRRSGRRCRSIRTLRPSLFAGPGRRRRCHSPAPRRGRGTGVLAAVPAVLGAAGRAGTALPLLCPPNPGGGRAAAAPGCDASLPNRSTARSRAAPARRPDASGRGHGNQHALPQHPADDSRNLAVGNQRHDRFARPVGATDQRSARPCRRWRA